PEREGAEADAHARDGSRRAERDLETRGSAHRIGDVLHTDQRKDQRRRAQYEPGEPRREAPQTVHVLVLSAGVSEAPQRLGMALPMSASPPRKFRSLPAVRCHFMD